MDKKISTQVITRACEIAKLQKLVFKLRPKIEHSPCPLSFTYIDISKGPEMRGLEIRVGTIYSPPYTLFYDRFCNLDRLEEKLYSKDHIAKFVDEKGSLDEERYIEACAEILWGEYILPYQLEQRKTNN